MSSWPSYSSHFAFFVLISIPLSSGFDSYTTCSKTFNCGGITKVGFPFWGDGRPDNCGYPELKLACSNDVTTIEIMRVKYRLLKINQDEQTLKVVRDDYYDKICSPKFGDTKLDSNLFDYVSGSSDFTLLYDCASSSLAEGFKCPDNETYANVAAVPEVFPGTPICKSKVVRISDPTGFGIISILNVKVLEAAVKEGFEVKYKVDSGKCDECVGSKGVCGYDWNLNETVCHCPNQTSEPRTCSAARTAAINNPAAVPLPPAKDKGKAIILVAILPVCFIGVLGAIVFGWCQMKAKQKGHSKLTRDTLQEYIGGKHDLSGLQIYDFDSILVATDNFSIANKLGQGGFGPVYRGKLAEGKEIAVKRLSSNSGQGVVEFRNEMLLISNLQHKNLVRIMGCCVKEDEKLLIYEFMPNKSLDTFLFDLTRRAVLDWGTRFNIIQGVANGLVYLHHDSYLKVIHRDLKVSNILLDEKMNPKISDFGLARSVEGTQNLENTQRVAGTRGYMSPEYAMGGIFSQKSDVYSFGVLVLEIISSKKNTAFYIYDRQLGLLAYAWQLWKEGRELELVDEMLTADSYSASEVMKCVHIGLLCVQDNAMDRPSVPDVVFMLNGSTTIIGGAQPKQPLFTIQNTVSHPQPQPSNTFLTNEATMTLIEGR
ncbi:G-type lectin S-receptor-like serine/threonine-protein kinase At1g61500 isoform X1 [Pyrus x bretschneideri]|uniref:G-type lectin S-receptor-like serine/threonine-protein kinase At1g61500 isoform X1 n=1 Tax=Pyrus x bretschneideri TaxID=225117 RepID=UPI00202F16B9|nr:G-type lectin S-receptor-like serine/threonine-protein kinase At1g61500 isoform X1 [Pyrus x bretschneideri]